MTDRDGLMLLLLILLLILLLLLLLSTPRYIHGQGPPGYVHDRKPPSRPYARSSGRAVGVVFTNIGTTEAETDATLPTLVGRVGPERVLLENWMI